jgi:hypothetical protein
LVNAQQEGQDIPQQQQQQQQQRQQGSTGACPAYLPTQATLLAAGRMDLVYGLRHHGYEAVRSYMQLPARYSRPKQKVQSTADASRNACYFCRNIGLG